MNEQAEAFFAEVKEAFQFLERQYSYRRLEGYVKYPNTWRDAVARCTYVGSHVGVEIWWYFADAAIGVTFVELQQPGAFPEAITLFHLTDSSRARAINLEDLAEMRDRSDDPDFLLKNKGKRRSLKKRETQIETRRQEIIAGLARATRTYATDILEGDTSIFPAAMDCHLEKEKKLYPTMYIPGLKQRDGSDQH